MPHHIHKGTGANIHRTEHKYDNEARRKANLPAKAGKRDVHCQDYPHCSHMHLVTHYRQPERITTDGNRV